MALGNFISLFLLITFVAHGVAFTILGVKRGRAYYFFLTGTFTFLSAIYFIKFEGWQATVPGTRLPATWLLRIGATACTLIYLRIIYKVESSWLWRLARRGRGR